MTLHLIASFKLAYIQNDWNRNTSACPFQHLQWRREKTDWWVCCQGGLSLILSSEDAALPALMIPVRVGSMSRGCNLRKSNDCHSRFIRSCLSLTTGVIRYKYPRWWILCDMIPMTRLATISICQIICDTNIKFSCLWPLLHTFSSYFFMWDIFVTWSKYFPFFRFCSQETNECSAMLSWECSNRYIRISACDILSKINILLSNNTSAAHDILNTNSNLRSEVVQNR